MRTTILAKVLGTPNLVPRALFPSRKEKRPGDEVVGHLGNTHAEGAYFILRYMYDYDKLWYCCFNSVQGTPLPPNNVDNKGTDKGRWNQHCKGGEGRGLQSENYA